MCDFLSPLLCERNCFKMHFYFNYRFVIRLEHCLQVCVDIFTPEILLTVAVKGLTKPTNQPNGEMKGSGRG